MGVVDTVHVAIIYFILIHPYIYPTMWLHGQGSLA